MGWFDDAFDGLKNVVKDPLGSIKDTASWIFPTVIPSKDSATIYGTAAGLAGAGATAAGALGAGSAAAAGAGDAGWASTAKDLISGGSDLLGGGLGDLIAGFTAGDWQKEINKDQLAWAREQTDIQKKSAETRYQTAVEDMRKAGINPMLAYKQGGAPMPGSISAPQYGNPVQAGVNSATQLRKSMNDTALAQASMAQTAEQIKQIKAQVPLTEKQTQAVATTIQKTNAEIAQIQYKAQSAGYAASLDKIVYERVLNSDVLQSALVADRISPSAKGIAAVAASIVEEQVKAHKITPKQAQSIMNNNAARAKRNANRRKNR